jgi:hypothetical protein
MKSSCRLEAKEVEMNKVISGPADAFADMTRGSRITADGFRLCGVPTLALNVHTPNLKLPRA